MAVRGAGLLAGACQAAVFMHVDQHVDQALGQGVALGALNRPAGLDRHLVHAATFMLLSAYGLRCVALIVSQAIGP